MDFNITNIGTSGLKAPNFNNSFEMNGIKISDLSKANKLSTTDLLEGHIQTNLNSSIDATTDQQLLDDVSSLLSQQNTMSGKTIEGISSADSLYNNFAEVLEKGIKGLNETQKDAERKTEFFASGGNIDVHTVMIAAEKANLNMQLALQVRNKIVMAYKEISKLQI